MQFQFRGHCHVKTWLSGAEGIGIITGETGQVKGKSKEFSGFGGIFDQYFDQVPLPPMLPRCTGSTEYVRKLEDIPALLRPLVDCVVFNNEILIEACPFCTPFRPHNLIKKRCICSFVEGWLAIAFKNEYDVHEVECMAKGDRACIFRLNVPQPRYNR